MLGRLLRGFDDLVIADFSQIFLRIVLGLLQYPQRYCFYHFGWKSVQFWVSATALNIVGRQLILPSSSMVGLSYLACILGVAIG